MSEEIKDKKKTAEEPVSEKEKATEEKQEKKAAETENEEPADNCEDTDGQAEEKPEGKPDKKDQKIAELNDRYLRLFAEFDNFRKRSETEKAAMFSEGEKTVLLTVLPLIDNFERALDSVPEEEKDSPFAEGIRKVYKAFTDQLKELGVTHIEAVGREFDANYHNAVMHVDDENEKENIIVEEFQKGYMFGEKVLRYSMVKVAN